MGVILESGCAKWVCPGFASGYSSDRDRAQQFQSLDDFRARYADDPRYKYPIMRDTMQFCVVTSIDVINTFHRVRLQKKSLGWEAHGWCEAHIGGVAPKPTWGIDLEGNINTANSELFNRSNNWGVALQEIRDGHYAYIFLFRHERDAVEFKLLFG